MNANTSPASPSRLSPRRLPPSQDPPLRSPTLQIPVNKILNSTPGASAASVRRLSTFSSIEHRALPSSPTLRRSRHSTTRRAAGSTTYSGGSEPRNDNSPTFSTHRASIGHLDMTLTSPPLSVGTPGGTTRFRSGEFPLPSQTTAPAAALLHDLSPPHPSSTVFTDASDLQNDGAVPSPFATPEAFDMRVRAAAQQSRRASSLGPHDDSAPVDAAVLRDFYESELLLFRNFGVEQQVSTDAEASPSSRRATPTAEAGPPLERSFGQRPPTLDVDPSTLCFVPPNAAQRRHSQPPFSPAPPPGDAQSYDAERRIAMRRRGSHNVDSDSSHSPHSHSPHSPHSAAAGAAPTQAVGVTRAEARSPTRYRGDSPVAVRAAAGAGLRTAAAPPSSAGGGHGSGSGSPHDDTSRMSPASGGVRSRLSSLFVAFAEPTTAMDPIAGALDTSVDQQRLTVSNNNSMALMNSSVGGTRRRGSWLETADGAPRTLTSSSRRVRSGVAVVDMEQEFLRYTNKSRHSDVDWDGACNCDEATIGAHIGKVSPDSIDATTMFHHCSWCQRRPSSFLCLSCGQTVCPSHVKAHADDDAMTNCVLFINTLDITTSFDRIYWCERCASFTFKYTDAYCAVADALVATRRTYLRSPATDIFMQHYQITDHAASSEEYVSLLKSSNPPPPPQPPAPAAATASGGVLLGVDQQEPTTERAVAMRLIASVASMQGWRSAQEDSEVAFYLPLSSTGIDAADFGGEGVLPARQFSVFCVFDGHGGDAVAKIASHNFEAHFVRSLQTLLHQHREILLRDPGYFVTSERHRESFFRELLQNTYIALDDELLNSADGSQGFYGTVGCTALGVVITPLDIVCASAGDSRACLFDVHRSRTHALSVDHTLDDEKEATRVVSAGYAIRDGRIEGQLAAPRALGDFDFKMCGGGKGHAEQAVSCVPDVNHIPRSQLVGGGSNADAPIDGRSSTLPPMPAPSSSSSPRSQSASSHVVASPPPSASSPPPPPPLSCSQPPEEWFVVLGCDGIWEVFSNDDCCAQLHEVFLAERRQRQLEQYLGSVRGSGAGGGAALESQGYTSLSPQEQRSPNASMAGSLPVGRRSRHGSMRSGHPSQGVVLHANVLNDAVATSICQLLKRAMALDTACEQEQGGGRGMDNMSIIVVRLALTR